MKNNSEQSQRQERWNSYGKGRLLDIQENPNKYIIDAQASPVPPWTANICDDELITLLSPMQIHDKKILELACGFGDVSVWLSKQGAKVTGVDLGSDLVATASALATVNQVDCRFQQCNITNLPFESDTYDIVLGLAILHHLSESDVLLALQESCRVLKSGGIAIFLEPVENSKLFDLIQNLFPAGTKGSPYYRPSILQRKLWNKYIRELDDRAMTNQELIVSGKRYFQHIDLVPYGFMIRLVRLIGYRYTNVLRTVDKFLFRVFPPLNFYNQTALVIYRK
jgi:2-polyprenyl-3-methyl-5-hydroxy-6-metoxy-1,4-benzoquinol methylase